MPPRLERKLVHDAYVAVQALGVLVTLETRGMGDYPRSVFLTGDEARWLAETLEGAAAVASSAPEKT